MFALTDGTGSGPITSTTTPPPRSSLSSTSKSASQMSRDSTTKVVTSSKPDINPVKRRKTEEVQIPKSSLELLKERKELLQRKCGGVTASTSTTISGSASKVAPPRLSTVAATARPGSGIKTAEAAKPVAEAPKPMSYRERMAAALQAGAEKKPAAGTITHKARPLVKEKKAWQLKLEGQGEGKGVDTAASRNSKSPGVSGGEKAASTSKKTADVVKSVTKKSSNGTNGSTNGIGSANGANGRKSSIGNGSMSSSKGKDKNRGKPLLEAGVKRKRESPPSKPGYSSYPRNKYSTNHKRYGAPRLDSYEEDDPDDDFVVNDEDEDDAYGRGGGYGGFPKKYVGLIHLLSCHFLLELPTS